MDNNGCGAGKGKQDKVEDFAPPGEMQLPVETFPVGMFNKAPETEEPFYYEVKTAADGRTVTIGPFDLTAAHIKKWAQTTTASDLNGLVERGALRASTALAVKSSQFNSILSAIESGQKPTEDLVKRFIPGDLQRVVARKICGK